MGFMDKAKKLAEQAQEKLDDAQKNFNKSDSPQAEPGQGPQFDEHGRPVQTPAAETPPPAAAPAAPAAPAPDAPAASTPDAPTEESPAPPPAPKQSEGGDSNASPDPFKPIQ
jgi:translation initiation factor IF-2